MKDRTNDHAHDLRIAIEKSGYYPDVVSQAVSSAVADERVVSYLVHHEPTIDERDEVRRHVTVLVLTPSRLILAHTDEHAPDDMLPAPYTSSSTEAVTLSAVRSVVVNRMVADPASAGEVFGGLYVHNVDTPLSLPFDHRLIIDTAVARLRSKSQYSSLPCYLAGETFTLPQLQRVYEAASPITYVSRRVPPTLLVYGGRDHVVEARFGRELHEKLMAAGATSVYLELPWAEHAFDKVPGVSAWVTRPYIERFLAKYLR